MIQNFALLSPILPIVVFLVFSLKTKKFPLWVIFIYLIVSFTLDLLSSTSWGRPHRIQLWNLFVFLEFAILLSFYYFILDSNKKKAIFSILIVAYFIVAIFSSNRNGEEFNSIMSAANAVTFLIFSIVYFIKSFVSTDTGLAVPIPIFCIVAGIMLNVSCTFFLYLISSRLSDAQMEKYWTINAVANILTNVIFSIAFILNRFQKKVPAPESHTPDNDGFPN